MREVDGVGLKNPGTNFRVEELFLAQTVSRYFPVQKGLVMLTPKPDNFMQLL